MVVYSDLCLRKITFKTQASIFHTEEQVEAQSFKLNPRGRYGCEELATSFFLASAYEVFSLAADIPTDNVQL